MPKTLRLLKEEITYSKAQREEVNILRRLTYFKEQQKFFARLSDNEDRIKAIVAHHLRLPSPGQCQVADVEDWLHGSFNVCIPVSINDWESRAQSGTCVLLRIPLPYRVGEEFCPGNSDEKIRCEAGTYAWLQQNCADVPIPRLYGFATSDGETLTHVDGLPFLSRCFQYLRRRLLSCLGCLLPSAYIPHPLQGSKYKGSTLDSGYLLVEFIERAKGEMLSSTWPDRHQNPRYRHNLFRDLSRILLSLTRIPLPLIGSFAIDKDGYIQLTNRPLSVEIQALENDSIPTDMSRSYTYSTVESYVVGLLRLHHSRLRNQPNAVNHMGDYLYQASALTAMQAAFPSFFAWEFCRCPFAFTLTDLHQSNIFVDDDWHITSLVDLEWTCSRPIEMIRMPTWLTNKAVDETAEDVVEYDTVRSEFKDILASEERSLGTTARGIQLSEVMDRSWRSGTFWFSLALASPTGLFTVFYKQIQPRFIEYCPDHDAFQEIMPWYWAKDFVRLAGAKQRDKIDYDSQLKAAFEVFDEAD